MALNFPDAPTVGDIYNASTWDGEKWTLTDGGGDGGGISDAPSDGAFYGRRSAAWSSITAYPFLATGGTTALTLPDRLFFQATVLDYGAVNNDAGVTACDTAINATITNQYRVLFPRGNYRISATATWPANHTYEFEPGATLVVDAGVTLTIRGTVVAPMPVTLFTGSGIVLGIRQVWPEWFGAFRNGVSNDQPAIQKAQNCIEASATSQGGPATLKFSQGNYGVASQILVTANTTQWEGQGSQNGTTFTALAAWSGPSGVIRVQRNPLGGVTGGTFSGFRVYPQTLGVGSTIGIEIGDASGTLDTVFHGGDHQAAIFSDITVQEFSFACWHIVNARLFHFDRCSAWVQFVASGICLRFRAIAATQFTGDLDFNDCQFVATATGALTVGFEGIGANAQIGGVGFHATIFYGGGIFMGTDSGGTVFDIWFTDRCQYDGMSGTINISANNGDIHNINFISGYYTPFIEDTAHPIFNLYVSGTGQMSAVTINDNYFAQTDGNVINFSGVNGFSACGNTFSDVNGGSIISAYASGTFNINNNRMLRRATSGSALNFIRVESSNYYTVRNNLCHGYVTGAVFAEVSPGGSRAADGNA